MTGFFDPLRPRLPNDKPTWLSARSALPGIWLGPEADNTWTVMMMVEARWAQIQISRLDDLAELLEAWKADPEEALRKWWKIEPPRGRPQTTAEPSTRSTTEVKSDDLGF